MWKHLKNISSLKKDGMDYSCIRPIIGRDFACLAHQIITQL